MPTDVKLDSDGLPIPQTQGVQVDNEGLPVPQKKNLASNDSAYLADVATQLQNSTGVLNADSPPSSTNGASDTEAQKQEQTGGYDKLQKVIKDVTGGVDVRQWVWQQHNKLIDDNNELQKNNAVLREFAKQPKFQQYIQLQNQLSAAKPDSPQYKAIQQQLTDLSLQPFADAPRMDLIQEANQTYKQTQGTQIQQNEDAFQQGQNPPKPPVRQPLGVFDGVNTMGDLIDRFEKNSTEAKALQDRTIANQQAINNVIYAQQKLSGFKGDKDGVREVGALANFGNGVYDTVDKAMWAMKYALSDDATRKAMHEQQQGETQILYPEKPSGPLSEFAGQMGTILPYLIPSTALEKLGVSAVTKTVGTSLMDGALFGLTNAATTSMNQYNEILDKTRDENQALLAANNTFKGGLLTGGAVGGLLMPAFGAASGKLAGKFAGEDIAGEIAANGGKNLGYADYMKYILPKHAVNGLPFGIQTYVDNKIAQENGSDRGALDNVGTSIAAASIMGAALDHIGYGWDKMEPKVRDAYLNGFAKYAPEQVTDAVTKAAQDGTLNPMTAEQIKNEVEQRSIAFAEMPKDLSPEQEQEVLPLVQQKNELLKQQAENKALPEEHYTSQIEQLDRKISETLGTPLTEAERKDYEAMKELQHGRNDAGQFENGLGDSEKDRLAHFEKRLATRENTKADGTKTDDGGTPDAKKTAETKPVAEATDIGKEAATKVGNVSISGHGEDEFTEQGKENGTEKKDDLTGQGVKEAEAQGEQLAKDNPDVKTIFHGTVDRTKQTADIVAKKASETLGREVKTVEQPLLDTWNIGKAEGKAEGSFDEKGWADKPDEVPPGGESWNTFAGRAKQAWEFLKAHPDNDHAIASSKMERMLTSLNEADGDVGKAKEIYFEKLAKENTTAPAEAAMPPEKQEGESIGTKNEITDKLLNEMELPEIMKPTVKRNTETFARVKAEVDNGTRDPLQTARDFLSGKKEFLDDEDHFAMDYALAKNKNERTAVDSKLADAAKNGDKESYTALAQEQARLRDEANTLIYAADKVGTVWGRTGKARQRTIGEDYSLQAVEARAKTANAGNEIPVDVQKRLDDLVKQQEESKQKIEDYEKQLLTGKAQKALEEIKKAVRTGRKRTIEVIHAERKQILANIKQKLAAPSPGGLSLATSPLFDILPDVGKLAKGYVEEGVIKLDDLVKKVHEDLKNAYAGLTEREVRDAISNYGAETKSKPLTKESQQLQQLKKQGKLTSTLEDVKQGEIPPKRAPVPSIVDPEAIRLRGQNERIKNQINREIKGLERQNRGKLETMIDFVSEAKRAAILSGYHVLGKLTGAGVEQSAVFTPLRKTIQTGLGKLHNIFPDSPIAQGLHKIAENAPTEGQYSVQSLAENYKQFWQKATGEEILKTLKTGKGDLDLIHGKDPTEPPKWSDFIQSVHAAIKVLPKRAEYYSSVQSASEWAIRKGLDLQKPEVQQLIHQTAYDNALRNIFMNKNAATKAYNGGLAILANQGIGGRTLANLLRVDMPVVAVPTNIANDVSSYAAGSLKALWTAGYHGKFNPDNLTPQQSDHVMRSLGKQAVGAIGMVVAAQLYGAFGGFYHKGDKSKSNVQPGDIQAGPLNVSHVFLHHPGLVALQLSADITKQIEQHKHDRATNKHNPFNAADAIIKSVYSVAKDVPFLEPQSAVIDAAQGNHPLEGVKKGATQQATSFIPQGLKEAAKDSDPLSRKPADIKEQLKLNIPGLRSGVTIDEKKEYQKVATKAKELVDAGKDGEARELMEQYKKEAANRATKK